MDTGLSYLKRTMLGEDYGAMARDRIGRIRRAQGYLNNGCIFSNYEDKASRYVFEEIDYLTRTLQNERIILWSSRLKPEYCHLYDNKYAIFTMQELSYIPNNEKLIVMLSPQQVDDKRERFHSLVKDLKKTSWQQARTRTYLYIDSVDFLIGDADSDKPDDPISDLLELLRHSRRKNIVITGVMKLPMVPEKYCYDFLQSNAAYLLVAGGVSVYDAKDLARLTGESDKVIYNIASYNNVALLHGEPQI